MAEESSMQKLIRLLEAELTRKYPRGVEVTSLARQCGTSSMKLHQVAAGLNIMSEGRISPGNAAKIAAHYAVEAQASAST